jgi:hypothetical protein
MAHTPMVAADARQSTIIIVHPEKPIQSHNII